METQDSDCPHFYHLTSAFFVQLHFDSLHIYNNIKVLENTFFKITIKNFFCSCF